jgi:hypothetical protein
MASTDVRMITDDQTLMYCIASADVNLSMIIIRVTPDGGELYKEHRGRTQRHAVVAKVRVFVRNPDELANERAELARLLNKAGTCFLHGTSLSTASDVRSLITIRGLHTQQRMQ